MFTINMHLGLNSQVALPSRTYMLDVYTKTKHSCPVSTVHMSLPC